MSFKPNPLSRFQDFRMERAVKGKARTVLIILMLVGVLVIGITVAVFAGRSAKPEEKDVDYSKCHASAFQRGWNGFSITAVALGIPLLIVSFIFFGCSTAVAENAWDPSAAAVASTKIGA